MHPNQQLIRNLYDAFNNKDYKAMNACYSSDATFSDPVFSDLKGKKLKAMWHMLCVAGKDLEVTLIESSANHLTGTSSWEAFYTFSATGNKVHNKVASEFVFENGLIVSQKDTFDFHKWAGMAMGVTGKILGWLPALQNKIKEKANENLLSFITKNPDYR